MIGFKYENNHWKYSSKANLPGNIKMNQNRKEIEVECIELSEAREMLGVLLASNGNNKEEVEKLKGKVQTFS